MSAFLRDEECPECGTRGYLVLPGYGGTKKTNYKPCQTCTAMRLDFLRTSQSDGGVDA